MGTPQAYNKFSAYLNKNPPLRHYPNGLGMQDHDVTLKNLRVGVERFERQRLFGRTSIYACAKQRIFSH